MKTVYFFLLLLPFSVSGQIIIDSYCLPEVVANGGSFKIQLEVAGGTYDSISIEQLSGLDYWSSFLLLNGSTFNVVTLFDDGTNGDITPNDNIYTREGFTYSFSGIVPLSNLKLFRNELLKFYDNGAVVNSYSFGLNTPIACYDPPQVTVPTVTIVNDTIQYTDKTINIKYPRKLGESAFPHFNYWINSEVFQSLFCDDFTFLIQNSTNSPNSSTSANGSFGPSSNFTQGIGKAISDLGLPFLGIISINWISQSHGIMQHEMLHKWAAQQDLYGDTGAGEGISGYGHWAWINMNESGLRGSTSFEFPTYNVVNLDTFEVYRGMFNGTTSWSNLELYMAGLMPIDSVPFPISYFTNVEVLNSTLSNPVIIKADLETVTESQWLSVVGPRVPAVDTNVYEIVQVVFSDELLTPGQLAYFDKSVEYITSTNDEPNLITPYEATSGLLTIKSKIIPKTRHFTNFEIFSDTILRARDLIILDSVIVHPPAILNLKTENIEILMNSEIKQGAQFLHEAGCNN